MVPITVARPGADGTHILLDCTVVEAARYPSVGEIARSPLSQASIDDPDWDVGVQDVVAVPQYGGGAFIEYGAEPDPNMMITYDRVPKGSVEIRHASIVTTADGYDAGRVEGFLLDAGRITHIVLHRGHLWGKREIAIPIEAVSVIGTDELSIGLSKAEVGALPELPVSRRRR